MKENIKNIVVLLNIYRLLPTWLIICCCKNASIIREDMQRWLKLMQIDRSGIIGFGRLLRFKEYRNLVYKRVKASNFFLSIVVKILWPQLDTLYIDTDAKNIGGGLFIQHGFSTIISAESIGSNCWINQQVTIGYEGKGCPIIGNNVRICAGAKIIGNISVGDNSIIGANAVVVKDVPSDVTVGGIPAKVIRYHSMDKA